MTRKSDPVMAVLEAALAETRRALDELKTTLEEERKGDVQGEPDGSG